MHLSWFLRTSLLLVLVAPDFAAAAPSKGYDSLVALFQEWRAFQQPKVVDGIPDYRPAAMKAQVRALPGFQARLASIDTRGWSVPEQVDARIVQAEMNGLSFDHRVLRPWANDPAFYLTVMPEQSDQPAPEGPKAAMLVDLWLCTFPLQDSQAAAIRPGLRAIPGLLSQARTNLVGNGRDLWLHAGDAIREQADALKAFAAHLEGPASAALKEEVLRALSATESYRTWVADQAKGKTGPSGIGVANYDWYLRHVQLLPYTWRDEVVLLERELARARSLLALEEQRNRALPELQPVTTAEEHARAFADAVPRYMGFLASQDVMTLPEFLAPALQAKVGGFTPGPRNFFLEVDYREPLALRTHGYHWFDLAWMENRPHPSPIRRGALLFNVFSSRTEGLATGWEEQMLQLGLFDARPRARELVYVLLAQRAARGLASLRMQANEFTLEQAARWAAAQTPRGWLRLDDGLVWGEQFLYLRQPNYGTSYVTGKIEMERLLAERKARTGAQFRLKDHMDAVNAAGLVPTSLLLWELAGIPPLP
ncbi:MAG: hypothetical protein H6Q88_2783 [Anaeromyxobacteraceae bacterium]|nr:hypothetical protein [Anaeromyxobacteraceae bacterium]